MGLRHSSPQIEGRLDSLRCRPKRLGEVSVGLSLPVKSVFVRPQTQACDGGLEWADAKCGLSKPAVPLGAVTVEPFQLSGD
jgi:hypothetical protein